MILCLFGEYGWCQVYATPQYLTGISTFKLTGRLRKMLLGHPYALDETICAENSLQKHIGESKRKAKG
jgi:hypothetical protein